ncbi:MAG: hypothetical protein J6A33_06300 [Alphaproteobacteria bacterium]|nr:hypothetical protein [Alphaproteobacteria bacterium]
MVSSIPKTTNRDENGVYGWEKTVKDVNNIDETFANARDLGYTRLNHARVTAVGKLGKYDSKDIYSIQVQSNGKLSIALRNTNAEEEKVLDLSKYEEKLDEIKKMLDPEGWKAEQDKKQKELEETDLLDTTAKGMTLKVYTVKNGRQVLLADSTAEKGSKEREVLEEILKGDYRAKAGNYYIEVGTQDGYEFDEDPAYAMQIMQGTTFKHDYVLTETVSDDTKNKKISTVPSETTSSGRLSAGNAMLIQAQRYQSTAQMLAVGYLNMASIKNKQNATAKLFSSLL